MRGSTDTTNIYDIIANLPRQFTAAFDSVSAKIAPDTKKIIFCGMGGSALPANLLKTYLANANLDFNIPIKINRDYSFSEDVRTLPATPTCGFFCSYSGNTEETLAALGDAEMRGLTQIVILAHGGKLAEIAKEKGYALVQLPDTNQPRMAYGFIVGAMLKIFANSGLLNIDFNALNADIQKLTAENAALETRAMELAKSVQNKIPVIYASNAWKYLAMVWKINFNENAKTPSFWNCFPELNHNEMVGYTNPVGAFKVIILKDGADNERNKKRMDIFNSLLKEKLNCEVIDMADGSPFYKMISTLSLGLWTSYYLAILNNLDPAPVALVEEFKRLMM